MKKYIFILTMILLGSKISMAEDIINVVPFEAKAGAVSEDAMSFTIEMTNVQDYWGIQFDLFLPEGMTLDTTGGLDPFDTELNPERYPYTVDRRGNKTYKHAVEWNIVSSGAYRFAITPNDNDSFITGTSGEILTLYYLTDENFEPGLHPFIVEGTVMAISGNSGVRPVASSSYCTVGESPLKTDAYVDLSALTGYLPSFVINGINSELAENKNLAEVDLTGVSSVYSALTPSNPNVLCYYTAGTEAATNLADTDNVVTFDGTSYACNSLMLDEDYPFACSNTVAVTEAKMKRNITWWNTICLPFTLSLEQVQSTFGEFSYFLHMDGFEENVLSLLRLFEDSEANVPYTLFVYGPNYSNSEYNFGAVSLVPNNTDLSATIEGMTLTGNYSGDIVDTAKYKLDLYRQFVAADESNPLKSFEAAFTIPDGTVAEDLSIAHDLTTSVDTSFNDDMERVDVYSICGICLKKDVLKSEAVKGLDKGVYIIGSQKVYVK